MYRGRTTGLAPTTHVSLRAMYAAVKFVISKAARRLSAIHRAVAVFAAAAVAVMLVAGAAAAEEVRAGDIVVSDAWGRASVGTAPGALYLTLRNEGQVPDTLTGIETPVATIAQLHVTRTEDGVVHMDDVDALDLPPGETVTLTPGGSHIMLMGLSAPLEPGQSVPLTLHFARAGVAQVTAKVGSIAAKGPSANP